MIDWQPFTTWDAIPKEEDTVLAIFHHEAGEIYNLATWLEYSNKWHCILPTLGLPTHWARLEPPK